MPALRFIHKKYKTFRCAYTLPKLPGVSSMKVSVHIFSISCSMCTVLVLTFMF